MVGVVMPHGILFRGGAEGRIRRGIEDALAQLRDAERRRDEAVVKMDELLAELGLGSRALRELEQAWMTDAAAPRDHSRDYGTITLREQGGQRDDYKQ